MHIETRDWKADDNNVPRLSSNACPLFFVYWIISGSSDDRVYVSI